MQTLLFHYFPYNKYYRKHAIWHLYLSYEATDTNEIHVPITGKRYVTDRAGKFLVPFLSQYIRANKRIT
jgi:hypothetical protein